MSNLPIMPILVVILLLLPIKVEPKSLMRLAFVLWLAGGLVLAFRGMGWILNGSEHLEPMMLALTIGLSAAIGIGKGKFVLGKTSNRNIARINAMTEPHKPIHVYSRASWIVIAVMVGISIALNFAPGLDSVVRGGVNLAVGMALVMSSLNYLKALGSPASARSVS